MLDTPLDGPQVPWAGPDRTKVHLESGRNDERIVRELAARVRADRIVRRVEGHDVLGNVRDVLRNKAGEWPAECRLLLQASTDESPVIRFLVSRRKGEEGRGADRTYHPGCADGR